MKINLKVLTAFIGYLKNSGHGIKERNDCLVLTRNQKEAIINDDEINSYGYQLYMMFMYQWLNKGKSFILKMQHIGFMIVYRLQGKNYMGCEK